MPLRKWPVAHTRPSSAPGRSRAGCPASRAQARDQLLDLELEDAGTSSEIAQQLVDAARGRGRVPAALLHRRAEHVAAVAARDEVGLLAADGALHEARGRSGSRSRSTWPLTGRTGTRAASGTRARDVDARGTTTWSAATVPSEPDTPMTRSPVDLQAVARRVAGEDLAPSAATSIRGSTEWSQSMSSASRTVGASAGSTGAPATAQPLDRQPEPAAELGQAIERLGLVAVAGDDERAHRGSPAPRARRRRRVAPRALQPELQQRLLAELGLRHGREHARGDVPGGRVLDPASITTTRAPRAQARHAQASPIGPPPTTATSKLSDCTDTGAYGLPTPARPGSRFDGRRPLAPSQPGSGLPCSAVHGIPLMGDPRERLWTARLYLVCPACSREWIAAAVRGGVDLIQLRDKSLDDDGILVEARAFIGHDALFILNDRPDLVEAVRRRRRARRAGRPRPGAGARAVGPDRIVGRSTHAPDQAAAADADHDMDYVAVGPVHATPTKPGRPAAGLHYVRTRRAPWPSPGSRSAAWTQATCTRWSSAGRRGSWSCARSPRRRTRECSALGRGRWRARAGGAVVSAPDAATPPGRGAVARADDVARTRRPAGGGFLGDRRTRAEAKPRRRASMRRGYGARAGADEGDPRAARAARARRAPLGLALAIGVVRANLRRTAILAAIEDHPRRARSRSVAALAGGPWARIYAVVVLVEALLALTIVFATLSLLFADGDPGGGPRWLIAISAPGLLAAHPRHGAPAGPPQVTPRGARGARGRLRGGRG